MRAATLGEWQGRTIAAWRAGWGVPVLEVYSAVGSTNDRALELASDPQHAFGVVIAEAQTAGRGRRGAGWYSPPGTGLWMSIVLPWSRPPAHAPLLVGLAAAEGIEQVASGVRVDLKWPNDVVVGGRKMGGVLCESAGGAAIAGIGINLKPLSDAPPNVTRRATSLEVEAGISLPASTLAESIIMSLRRRAAPSTSLDGPTLAQLQARDALAGHPVDTDQHGHGVARGIDSEGALLLERPDGSRVRVLAGSVRPL